MTRWFRSFFLAAVLAVIPSVAEIPDIEECEDPALQLSQLRATAKSTEAKEPNETQSTLSEDDILEAFMAAQPDYNDTEASDSSLPTLKSGGHHGIRHAGNVRTLYHQTSSWAGNQILKNGFRRGHIGFCGGGIYFALSPQATYGKAVGVDSNHGFIIEARVDLGRVHTKGFTCTTSVSCWAKPLKQTIQCLDRGFHGGHWQNEGYDSILFNPGDGGEKNSATKSAGRSPCWAASSQRLDAHVW